MERWGGMITSTDLTAADYRKYPAPFKQHAACMYQKRFDDAEGKKYFLQFYEYDNREYLARPTQMPEFSYSSDAQFKDAYGNTFNVECLTNDSIESVEAFFERVWVSCGCVHYEEWGDYA